MPQLCNTPIFTSTHWIAGYSNWNIIINTADYMLIIWLILFIVLIYIIFIYNYLFYLLLFG